MEHSNDWAVERFVKKQAHDPRNIACAKGFTIFAALSHLYFLTNNINNYDNISAYHNGFGAGFSSGRWLLGILDRVMERLELTYNIPIFNAAVGLIFLFLSAVLAIHILNIEDTKLCFGLGAITASISVIAGTMLFAYTVHVYFLSILLGTIGVSLALKNKWYRFFAPVLFAMSMGIYQGYFPFFTALLVLALTCEAMNDEISWKTLLKNAFLYLTLLILGCLFYMVLNKFFLALFHTALSNYQGINEMGQLGFRELVMLIKKSYLDFGRLFTDGYRGISTMPLIKVSIIANLCFAIFCVILDWRNRTLLKNIELCVLLILLPLAANAIVIMVPKGDIHILMLYGLLSLFYLPLVMVQNLKRSAGFRKAAIYFVCAVTLLASLNYAYQDNANYRSLYYSNRTMENYFATLIGQARSVDGFHEDMEIVLTDETIYDNSIQNAYSQDIFHLFVANPDVWIAINAYSRNRFIYQYFGYNVRNATEDELSKYASFLDEMDTYPNSGSIRLIDNKVFVKCGQ